MRERIEKFFFGMDAELLKMWGWARGINLRKLSVAFGVYDKLQAPLFNRRDQLILLAISFVFMSAFMFKQLAYECDAAMFFSYAKAIFTNGGSYTYWRPPIFPVFLGITGQVLFESFIGTVIAHAAMGLVMPVLVYRTLAPVSPSLGMTAGLILIASTLPYFAIKLMLATQLFLFLVLVCVYFYSRYYFKGHGLYVYAAVGAALLAMFTRWEGLFLLLVIAVSIGVLAFRNHSNLRAPVFAVIVAVTVIGSWSYGRSILLKDPNMIGTLHNGSGRQLLWRVGLHNLQSVWNWEVRTGIRAYEDTSNLVLRPFEVTRRTGPREQFHGVKMIDPSNGPATAELRRVMIDYLTEFPGASDAVKGRMLNVWQPPNQPRVDLYQEYFGKFKGNPKALVNNMFNHPNTVYPSFIFGGLLRKLGIARTDQLLRDVAMEAAIAHPAVLLVWLNHALTFISFDLNKLWNVLQGINVADNRPFAIFWAQSAYSKVGFNLGGCASNSLSPGMLAEYTKDQSTLDQDWIHVGLQKIDTLRNVVRNVVGPLAVIFWVALFFSVHRGLYIPVALTCLAFIGVYSVLAGAVYTRYEFPVQPLLIIATCGAIHSVWRKLKDKFASSG